jgi:catechol 2,3-dioxygenase-like lactoylglutathione lyase family enzyme
MATALPASDLERARKWYAEKLGLQPVREDEFMILHYETGGSQFIVYQSEFAGTNKATAAGWSVDDFDEIVIDLRDRGVEFEDVDLGENGRTVDGVITSPDGEYKGAWFKDSEGNILSINNM